MVVVRCALFGQSSTCQSVSSRGAAAVCDYATGFLHQLRSYEAREGGIAWALHGPIIILWNRFGKRQLRKNRPGTGPKREGRGFQNLHTTKNGGCVVDQFERGRDG